MTHFPLRNLKITCSWNGKDFSGYQIQPHARTIEGILSEAWKILVGDKTKAVDCGIKSISLHTKATTQNESASPTPNRIIGCSRLDAGVHAYHYVFNVYSNTIFATERIVKSLNGILHDEFKADICIYACEDVDEAFHARFSAIGKHYRYLIWHGFSDHIEFRHCAWHIKTKKNLDNLETILKKFEGTHNFNSFRASDCGSKNPVKTITKIEIKQHEHFPELYMIDIFGDGFLKNMIRNIVGMGILIINEKKEFSEITERLESGKKGYNLCAPAHALTLMRVYYFPMQNVENIF